MLLDDDYLIETNVLSGKRQHPTIAVIVIVNVILVVVVVNGDDGDGGDCRGLEVTITQTPPKLVKCNLKMQQQQQQEIIHVATMMKTAMTTLHRSKQRIREIAVFLRVEGEQLRKNHGANGKQRSSKMLFFIGSRDL